MVDRLKRIALWRWALLWVLAWAWFLATAGVMGDRIVHRVGPLAWFDGSVLLAPSIWLVLGLLYWLSVVAFVLGRWERLTGAWIFVWLGGMGLLEMGVRTDSMPPLVNLMGANLVLAWLIGSNVPASREVQERRGQDLMCGVFGAMLTLAGISKLRHAGWNWFDGNVHALFIWERAQPLVAPPFMLELRMWLAQHPFWAGIGATYAVLVECLGGLFVVERFRKPFAIAVMLMFFSMNLSLGLGEQGWVAVPLALAWSRPRPS